MSPAEKRELMNSIFQAGLVILAIFLGFVGVLAAVQPSVERLSYLRGRCHVSVYASLAGIILSGAVSAGALARLSGYYVPTDWIIFAVYLLILAVIVATVSLSLAIGL